MFKKLRSPRAIFGIVYLLFFMAYIFVGLQPAEATSYKISGKLEIPSINLVSDVTTLTLENQKLTTPDNIVGAFSSNKKRTLLMGHSTTVFSRLKDLKIGDEVSYNGEIYIIYDIKTVEKDSIKMVDLLKKTDQTSIVLMTCAGTLYGNQDASHRLIITANKAELAERN